MIRKITFIAGVAAVTLGAASVAGASEQTAEPAAAPAVLTATDAVTPVTLPAGVTSSLQLETNPSTGYGWQVVETVNLRVEEPFETVRLSATPGGMVGAPETAIIRITPRGKGPASLTLVYKRPWMATTAEDRTLSFVFSVE